jgi:alkanesulfonate monooxygenase SsuD/methylene tetrahydromethanopterin reductase-like flavin-dependent oxidoreductase (luciferase family)
MKFGIFFQMQVPRPWRPGLEQEIYANHLEQARHADKLGFDVVWATEHHFLEEYSHNSAPEVLLSAIAAQTENIRLGHGVVVCVPQINHPIRVAERAAALDIISNGRVEVGTGRSGTWTELAGFGVNPDTTKKTWDEYVRILPKMWTQDRFSYEGRDFRIPERAILPKPVQQPHPPLWVAVTSPGTEWDAADRGIGCLWLGTDKLAQLEARTAEYRRRLQQCEPVGAVNDNVFALNYLYCHEDAKRAVERGNKLLDGFNYLNRHLVFTREVFASSAYQTRGNLINAPVAAESGRADSERAVPEGACIGTPDDIVEQIKRWESTGIDGINFVVNGASVIPQQEVLNSMALFASTVMPVFR